MRRRRPQTLVAMGNGVARQILTEPVQARLRRLVDVDPHLVATDLLNDQVRPALTEAEVLLTSWGCPRLSTEVLAAAPRLRAVVHAAGSVKPHITDACWERGIQVSSAASANAVPVAEYTVAAILFANKHVLEIAGDYQRSREWVDWTALYPGLGNYRKTVGIIGASRVGRRVMALLKPFDMHVYLADPYVSNDEARALGAQLTTLDDLVASSDVVSLHAPALPDTYHLIGADELARMRDGAVLINTARPSLVDQKALTKELETGRLRAVLDVTEPEPLPADSSLFDMPNVLITPHIAGSLGDEVSRMAESALEELDRYTRGLPFAHPVTPDDLARSA
ncbi:hydroxyacid dehydrogenase [Phytoactinopolyspora mesophila]|uniref:Hydroxyacid dehydrogenase n=1 Tax=Phytoactinopolyspora mesophila TaxID=2650750 RepID=A0A7K3LYD9_9ACTN|nr:hydroxyacid dehydrogenase [Phytoactinopolyspora mesophila]NDL56053.1 hydroxyacid dehydrogenase [Phytoactinopolyspora mesophila]